MIILQLINSKKTNLNRNKQFFVLLLNNTTFSVFFTRLWSVHTALISDTENREGHSAGT